MVGKDSVGRMAPFHAVSLDKSKSSWALGIVAVKGSAAQIPNYDEFSSL